MTAPHEHPGEHPPEPDHVPMTKIAVVLVTALVVFVVGGLWSASVQRGETGSVRADVSPAPSLAGSTEVGIVYQRPFAEDPRAPSGSSASPRPSEPPNASLERARRRLETSGWVDRDAGTVHVPIEDAMEIVAKRGRL